MESQEKTQPENHKPRLITPVLAKFMAAMVLANVAGSMQGMMLPLFVSELGASVAQVGLVFTLANIVPLILQVFGGWFSDNYGRKMSINISGDEGVFVFFLFRFPHLNNLPIPGNIVQE